MTRKQATEKATFLARKDQVDYAIVMIDHRLSVESFSYAIPASELVTIIKTQH